MRLKSYPVFKRESLDKVYHLNQYMCIQWPFYLLPHQRTGYFPAPGISAGAGLTAVLKGHLEFIKLFGSMQCPAIFILCIQLLPNAIVLIVVPVPVVGGTNIKPIGNSLWVMPLGQGFSALQF